MGAARLVSILPMRPLILLATLFLGVVSASASVIAPCLDCEAILRACVSRAWWQVDVDRCHQEAAGCRQWCEFRNSFQRGLNRPDPWTATVKRQ